VGKGAPRRAHHLVIVIVKGGHASLCPPYEISIASRLLQRRGQILDQIVGVFEWSAEIAQLSVP